MQFLLDIGHQVVKALSRQMGCAMGEADQQDQPRALAGSPACAGRNGHGRLSIMMGVTWNWLHWLLWTVLERFNAKRQRCPSAEFGAEASDAACFFVIVVRFGPIGTHEMSLLYSPRRDHP